MELPTCHGYPWPTCIQSHHFIRKASGCTTYSFCWCSATAKWHSHSYAWPPLSFSILYQFHMFVALLALDRVRVTLQLTVCQSVLALSPSGTHDQNLAVAKTVVVLFVRDGCLVSGHSICLCWYYIYVHFYIINFLRLLSFLTIIFFFFFILLGL